MHVILNQGHLMIVCNTVTSIITCFPNLSPWPYGIDFHAALLPLHRAEANIWWIGLKINVLSTVWLIHGLSGVITVPSTTMRCGEDVLSRRWEMNELTPSKWEEYAKICYCWKSTESCLPHNHRKGYPGPVQWLLLWGHLIINLINRHLWRGLALTLSNYHTALWWSIWVESFGAGQLALRLTGSVCCERETKERRWAVTWDRA